MCGAAACLRFVSSEDVIVEETPWGPNEWFVQAPMTGSEHLMLVRLTMPPGRAHRFHRHPHFEEAIYYLEGTAEQWVGEERRAMKPGMVAHIPADTVHGTYNDSDAPCTILVALASPRFQEPMVVDVSREEPWASLRPSS